MMDMLLMIIKAFAVGGVLCAIGQVLILKTPLTSWSARLWLPAGLTT